REQSQHQSERPARPATAQRLRAPPRPYRSRAAQPPRRASSLTTRASPTRNVHGYKTHQRWRRSCEDQRTLVELQISLGEPRHREFVGPLVTRFDEAIAKRFVVEEPLQRRTQRARIPRWHEERIAIGSRHVLVTLDRGRNDRRARRHRFEEHD